MKRISQVDKIVEIDVLLIEDNPDDALLLQECLSETVLTTCSVKWVEQLNAGLQWLNKRPVDIILLDLMLPDSKGMESLQGIKLAANHIPVVVLTGLNSEEVGRQAIQEGAQDYICKNEMNPNLLENSIRFAIERHQLLKQLGNKKQQLQNSESRLRRIVENNADGIAVVDREGNLIYLNHAAEHSIRQYCEEDNTQDYQELIQKLSDVILKYAGVSLDSIELNLSNEKENKKNNIPGIVEIRVKEIDWEGKPAYLASFRDITERKQLEKSLLIEKERLDITLRSIADGVITTDRNGHILSFNTVATHLTGMIQLHVTGVPIFQILDVDFPSNEEQGHELYYNTCIINGKEIEIVIEYSRAPILGKDNEIIGYIFVLRDITMRKMMAEEMLKIQKLESLGVVAGRLAHEYDNVLTVILGNLSISKKQLPDHPETIKILEKAEMSLQRARELTGQLHTFSRSDITAQKSGSIVRLLRDITGEFLESSPVIFNAQWDVDSNLWDLEFDKNQLYTALWNIVKNAVESMPEGGLLDFSFENVIITEKNYLPLRNGKYVKISITDHGTGMEKETLRKIFDPFFTTKENSSGMGLTAAFAIIRKHNGNIEAVSEKNQGSTFRVFLPAIQTPDSYPRKAPLKTER